MYKPLNWIPSRPSSPTLFEYVWFNNVVADPGTLSVAFTVKLTVLTLVFYVVTGTPVPVTNWPGKIAVLAAANSICNALKAALFYCSCSSLVAPLIAKGAFYLYNDHYLDTTICMIDAIPLFWKIRCTARQSQFWEHVIIRHKFIYM